MSNGKILGFRFLRLVLLVAIGIAASGCVRSFHYTPKPDRNFESILEFSSSNAVTLKNVQPSTTETIYAEHNTAIFYANLNAWTDVAIEITRRELEKRGMNVVATPGQATSQKVLKLSVDDADKIVTFATLESTIKLQVETGDGYSAVYVGRNKYGVICSHYNQVDGAMMRSVVLMLRDPRIVAYITSTE